MDYQLKGKLAFFTAGAHGIGEAIADLLTEEGAQQRAQFTYELCTFNETFDGIL